MRYVFALLFLFAALAGFGQITVQFSPELGGRSLDGLLTVKFLNSGQSAVTTDLTIQVRNRTTMVMRMTLPGIQLLPGINALSRQAMSRASIRFENNPVSRLVKQSSALPDGEYQYCFLVSEAGKGNLPGTLLAEECIDYEVEAFSPLSLTEPYHRAEICERRPTLVWQPLFPSLPGMFYQLTLTELKAKQSPTEALFYNVPLINQRQLTASYLPYPSITRDLDTGKTYVWQVTAYKGELVVSRSETWTFQVRCEEEKQGMPVDGFRNIENLVLGNYYVAAGQVLFALDNPYTATKLAYHIECLSDPSLELKNLPEIPLRRGKNQVVVPLQDVSGMKDDYKYIMKIKLPNGTEKHLRFVYKAP